MAGTGPAKTEMRAHPNFLNAINVIWGVQSRLKKHFRSRFTQINSIPHAIPSRTEGRIAIVTDVGHGMRWTRQHRAREVTQGGFPVSDHQAR